MCLLVRPTVSDFKIMYVEQTVWPTVSDFKIMSGEQTVSDFQMLGNLLT